ncbi:hypothetical protein COO60DRAFT_1642100 [Scenedesmus sp. NREL 46B-D3]|nr:hypothetical protein COO60DRAFT_1642100 [Scenedesmus sp. NREL 46B-D3]
MQALPCLAQLSSSTMQLAAAVFCQPDTALQLLTAGTYATAAEQLKTAVKELVTLLVKAVEATAAAAAAAAADSAGQDAGDASSSAAHAFLQGLLPAAQAAAQQLLHMGMSVAAFISSTPPPPPAVAACDSGSSPGSSSQVPKEMRSMAVLSLSWTNLTKLLMAVPSHAREQVLQPEAVLQGLRCALTQLQRAVREMPQQAPEKREVVARFWMQNVSRLTGSVSSERVALGALGTLLEVALEVFDAEDASFTQQKLELLLNFTQNRAADAAATAPDDLLQVQLHVLVVLDLMQQLPSLAFAPLELLQQASCKLLGWAVHSVGCRLCPVVLADDAGGALLPHTLQCCLAFVLGCMTGLGQQVQQDMLALLTRMSCSEHPVVAFLTQQLLAETLACGSEDLLLLQLSGLLQLLQATAACAALPGADSAFSRGTEALVDTMSAVLQCSLLQQLGQRVLQGSSQPPVAQILSQLWLTAQQAADTAAGCEQLLVLHQLTWQAEAMQALLQLHAAHGASSPTQGSSLQGYAAFALDLLKVVLVQEGAEELLQLLQGIAARHEPLHALLAAVCGGIGVPAGNVKHEAMFQQLLASPHWPVRHAAFDGLLARLRHSSYSGNNIVRLLPPCMRVSATEASPAVVQVVKAHLQRQPDVQVGLSAAAGSADGDGNAAAAAAGPVQALLQLAATAGNGLEALDKALCQAESEVRLLLSAASAAAHGHQLGGEEVVLLSRQGSHLAGGCASMCSRLRALQDQLACLK